MTVYKFNLIWILILKTESVKDSKKVQFYVAGTHFQLALTTPRNAGFILVILKSCLGHNLTIGTLKRLIERQKLEFLRLGDITEYDNGMIIIAGWDGEGTTEYMKSTTEGLVYKCYMRSLLK